MGTNWAHTNAYQKIQSLNVLSESSAGKFNGKVGLRGWAIGFPRVSGGFPESQTNICDCDNFNISKIFSASRALKRFCNSFR